MQVVNDEIWVCSECMIWLVNGDVSGVEDAARVEAIQAGERALGEHIVSNFSEGEGEDEFSTAPCECCGTSLHGARYRMAQLGE